MPPIIRHIYVNFKSEFKLNFGVTSKPSILYTPNILLVQGNLEPGIQIFFRVASKQIKMYLYLQMSYQIHDNFKSES